MRRLLVKGIPLYAVALMFGQASHADPENWLDRLNYYRAMANLPPVSENTVFNDGCWKHARYMVKNDELTHFEDSTKPWYTSEGEAAGLKSNVYVHPDASTKDAAAVDWWMTAPFHAIAQIDPELHESGFGSYREQVGKWKMGAALDVLRGHAPIPPSVIFPVHFPEDGSYMPLWEYGGGEEPNPLAPCPGYSTPSGPPIMLQMGDGTKTPKASSSTFKEDGVVRPSCFYDATKYDSNGVLSDREAVVIMPKQPLQEGKEYEVSATVDGKIYKWSFTTRPAKLWGNILWYHKLGIIGVWYMDGGTFKGGKFLALIPFLNWKPVATGDLDNNGTTDIIGRNIVTGDNAVIFMRDDTIKSVEWLPAQPDLDWRIVATGDFNKDGRTDLLWQNNVTGNGDVWLLDGVKLIWKGTPGGTSDLAWRMVGTGDFNGDLQTDIVWRNTTGVNAVWYMKGHKLDHYGFLDPAHPDFELGATGDLNNDGKPDIIWRNTESGYNWLWYMDGDKVVSTEWLLIVEDQNWRMVGTGNFE